MSDSIYQTLNQFISYEARRVSPQPKLDYLFSTLVGKLHLCAAVCLVLMLISGALYNFLGIVIYKQISQWLLLSFYIIYFIQPIAGLYEARKELKKFIFTPMLFQLDEAQKNSLSFDKYVPVLIGKDESQLKLVKHNLESHIHDFQRRVLMVAGNFLNLGAAPGLLALAYSWDKLGNITEDWVVALAYALPFVYVFAMFCHVTIGKLERCLCLLNYVIEQKESIK